MRGKRASSLPLKITDTVLRRWPLPVPGEGGDKESRGHVLVVAGSREMPGAALLAATSALRAGAGKLTIAAPESVAMGLALAIPESRVIALQETKAGGVSGRSVAALAGVAQRVQAAVVGPGMLDERGTAAFVHRLLPLLKHATVVLDALAICCVKSAQGQRGIVLTPHAGEMAHLCGLTKDAVLASPQSICAKVARDWGVVVALKGGNTVISAPSGEQWHYLEGSVGLATSGSGDTLAGIIAGLAARGADSSQAAVWGVALHGRAGAMLSREHGPLGYLASELPGKIPAALQALAPR